LKLGEPVVCVTSFSKVLASVIAFKRIQPWVTIPNETHESLTMLIAKRRINRCKAILFLTYAFAKCGSPSLIE